MHRILYLVETLGHGGAEHQLVATVKRLDRSRFVPIVCHFRGPSYLADELRDAHIQVENLDVLPGKARWPDLIRRIAMLIRRTRPDLIHTSLLEADVVGGLAGKLCKVPVLSTLCNIAGDPIRLADNPRNNRLKFAVTNAMWGSALRRLHRHSIGISNAVRDSAVATFGMNARNISVIYRGLDIHHPGSALDRDEVRGRLGLVDTDLFLLSVGRLAPQKGHRYLIAAFAQLIELVPNAKLVIVGEGWLRSELEQLARDLSVDESVSFAGKRGDVPDLMRACDIFLFPSLFEGLGVSLLEASLAGCACIATDVGPIPEIIEDGRSGLLVPPRDSGALLTAMLRLIQEPELGKRLGESARKTVQERFSLEEKVRELEQVYGSILAASLH